MLFDFNLWFQPNSSARGEPVSRKLSPSSGSPGIGTAGLAQSLTQHGAGRRPVTHGRRPFSRESILLESAGVPLVPPCGNPSLLPTTIGMKMGLPTRRGALCVHPCRPARPQCMQHCTLAPLSAPSLWPSAPGPLHLLSHPFGMLFPSLFAQRTLNHPSHDSSSYLLQAAFLD